MLEDIKLLFESAKTEEEVKNLHLQYYNMTDTVKALMRIKQIRFRDAFNITENWRKNK